MNIFAFVWNMRLSGLTNKPTKKTKSHIWLIWNKARWGEQKRGRDLEVYQNSIIHRPFVFVCIYVCSSKGPAVFLQTSVSSTVSCPLLLNLMLILCLYLFAIHDNVLFAVCPTAAYVTRAADNNCR